jgi:uncharacterized protein with PIN domain
MISRSIICPFCQHEYNNDDMHKAQNDLFAVASKEQHVSEICPSCSQEFWIQGDYEPWYETFKTEFEHDDNI